ncbi:MAG: glycerophosphodiester phosphodiesterase family protein [Planctomycetota bacterium]
MTPHSDDITVDTRALAGKVLRRVRQRWRSMAIMHVAVDALLLVTLSPVLAWTGRRLITSEDRVAVSNTDLVGFFISFSGVALACLVAVSFFATRFSQLTGVLVIVGGEGPLLRRFWTVVRFGPRLVQLAAVLIGVLVLAALPGSIIALASAWPILTSDVDINFYLAERPPTFWWSLVGVIVGVVIAAGACLFAIARVCLSLPITLFEEVAPLAAIRESWRLTGGRSNAVARLLVGFALVALGIAVAAGLVTGGIVASTSLVPPSTFAVLLVAAAAVFQAMVAIGVSILLVSVFGTLLALLASRLGREVTLHDDGGQIIDFPLLRWRNGLVVWAAGVITLIVAVGTTLAAGVQTLERPAPLIIAHRGTVDRAPENTLLAFTDATKAGTDVVELDVQRSSDGVVMVVHDADLMRLAGRRLKVADTTAAELMSVPLGPDGDQRMPTLREALETVAPDARVLIELKYYGFDDQLVPAVVRVVDELDLRERVLVMSLDAKGVGQTRELAPDIPVGLTVATSLGDLSRLDIDFVAIGQSAAKPRTLDRLHDAGIDVYVWTVNDADAVRRFLAFGVDGLITDRVDIATTAIEAWSDETAVEQALIAFKARWFD